MPVKSGYYKYPYVRSYFDGIEAKEKACGSIICVVWWMMYDMRNYMYFISKLYKHINFYCFVLCPQLMVFYHSVCLILFVHFISSIVIYFSILPQFSGNFSHRTLLTVSNSYKWWVYHSILYPILRWINTKNYSST